MFISESNYVDKAEAATTKMRQNVDKRGNLVVITTSKIRNILAMSASLYNDIVTMQEQLDEETSSRIDYLRIRCLYEAGRDKAVKSFMEETKILDILKDIKGSRKNFILFNHYLEALVAFHRYYGGKD